MSINELKAKLERVNFLSRYPEMTPYVGPGYISENHKRLLIIGESHFPAHFKRLQPVLTET